MLPIIFFDNKKTMFFIIEKNNRQLWVLSLSIIKCAGAAQPGDELMQMRQETSLWDFGQLFRNRQTAYLEYSRRPFADRMWVYETDRVNKNTNNDGRESWSHEAAADSDGEPIACIPITECINKQEHAIPEALRMFPWILLRYLSVCCSSSQTIALLSLILGDGSSISIDNGGIIAAANSARNLGRESNQFSRHSIIHLKAVSACAAVSAGFGAAVSAGSRIWWVFPRRPAGALQHPRACKTSSATWATSALI